MAALLLSVLLLQADPARERWENVLAIAPQASTRVTLSAGAITGEFVSATPDSILIRAGQREIRVDRASVKSVDRGSGKSRRGRNIGIGLFAGMGTGALIYGVTCGTNCMAEGAPVWTAPLSLIGALAGAAAPPVRWQRVYQR